MERLPDVIETERIRLRPFRLQDVDDVLSYASDPEWGRYLPVPQPYGKEDAERFIARQLLSDREADVAWAVEYEGDVVGGINIALDFDNRLGELGYSIARDHWGKGLATEAAKAVIDAAFTAYEELNRIRAMADARNVASQRVMEKVGMEREGLLRQNRMTRGEFIDEAWYGLLRTGWEEQQ